MGAGGTGGRGMEYHCKSQTRPPSSMNFAVAADMVAQLTFPPFNVHTSLRTAGPLLRLASGADRNGMVWLLMSHREKAFNIVCFPARCDPASESE